jgi:hypothetical protein
MSFLGSSWYVYHEDLLVALSSGHGDMASQAVTRAR